ncbi:hypothetical protein C2845_PM08G25030 [Panicum miliaceum]|uniref:Uncharacterized protein n=1 Tax=Panicum miliaceum TaxID=4540 RepID=A0A3L6R2R9_PANMI|nr:hypothetical protein C2845_PM08G25030 [Panicum miliaceum]
MWLLAVGKAGSFRWGRQAASFRVLRRHVVPLGVVGGIARHRPIAPPCPSLPPMCPPPRSSSLKPGGHGHGSTRWRRLRSPQGRRPPDLASPWPDVVPPSGLAALRRPAWELNRPWICAPPSVPLLLMDLR